MQKVYPLLDWAEVIFLASPIFFYGVTAQAKALIDRSQAHWSRRLLEKTPEERQLRNRGRGYLITVGATRGKNLFEGAILTAKYFFDALDMSYEGGIFSGAWKKGMPLRKTLKTLQEAFTLGLKAATP